MYNYIYHIEIQGNKMRIKINTSKDDYYKGPTTFVEEEIKNRKKLIGKVFFKKSKDGYSFSIMKGFGILYEKHFYLFKTTDIKLAKNSSLVYVKDIVDQKRAKILFTNPYEFNVDFLRFLQIEKYNETLRKLIYMDSFKNKIILTNKKLLNKYYQFKKRSSWIFSPKIDHHIYKEIASLLYMCLKYDLNIKRIEFYTSDGWKYESI